MQGLMNSDLTYSKAEITTLCNTMPENLTQLDVLNQAYNIPLVLKSCSVKILGNQSRGSQAMIGYTNKQNRDYYYIQIQMKLTQVKEYRFNE